MAAQELLEGAGQLARRARISGLVALCAVELCFLWVSIKSDVKVQRCYFYYNPITTKGVHIRDKIDLIDLQSIA